MSFPVPRRFDERETSLILEQASKMDVAASDHGNASFASGPSASEQGLTLAELQAIGVEAGIAPLAISRAALAVQRGDHEPAQKQTAYGLPVGVDKTVRFDRAVTDLEWERMVVALRRTFGARGKLQTSGNLREWSNGNLRAMLEPTATGHQIRLTTRRGDASMYFMLGTIMSILGLSLAGLMAIRVGMDPGAPWLTPISIGAAGLLAFVRNALVLPRWSRVRATQMTVLSAELAEIAPTQI